MTWILCKKFKNKRLEMPILHINKNGVMSFNSAAINDFLFSEHQYLRFFYDTENQYIAIERFGKKVEEGSVKITKKHAYSIISFLRYYGIEDYEQFIGDYHIKPAPGSHKDEAFLVVDLGKKL